MKKFDREKPYYDLLVLPPKAADFTSFISQQPIDFMKKGQIAEKQLTLSRTQTTFQAKIRAV